MIIIFGIVCVVCGYLAGNYMGRIETIEKLVENRDIDLDVYKKEMNKMLLKL